MKVAQRIWDRGAWRPLDDDVDADVAERADLVLLFGARTLLEAVEPLLELRALARDAIVAGCSTAGEIAGDMVLDGSLVATAVRFASSRVAGAVAEIGRDATASRTAGEILGRALAAPDLVHVLVFSEGLNVNGSALVEGLAAVLPDGVSVSGGLSGDGESFVTTKVVWNGQARSNAVVGVGLCGAGLRVGTGSLGGWDPFGPERRVTRAADNELFELDGRSALELYRRYLGGHADGLPATGLLFPLAVRSGPDADPVVRTILGFNEERQSLIFAGEVPEGSLARLMKANFDRLIDGATDAALGCRLALADDPAELALLISCVGRKMVLRQRIEEEVESVREVLGPRPTFTGFYSYGEISPTAPGASCALHNQTMTITTLLEP